MALVKGMNLAYFVENIRPYIGQPYAEKILCGSATTPTASRLNSSVSSMLTMS